MLVSSMLFAAAQRVRAEKPRAGLSQADDAVGRWKVSNQGDGHPPEGKRRTHADVQNVGVRHPAQNEVTGLGYVAALAAHWPEQIADALRA